MIPEPDFAGSFGKLEEAQAIAKFNFSSPGWYYRDEGRSCLLLTREDERWVIRVWNAWDPRPVLLALSELQVHQIH